jgi:hypothetical protein
LPVASRVHSCRERNRPHEHRRTYRSFDSRKQSAPHRRSERFRSPRRSVLVQVCRLCATWYPVLSLGLKIHFGVVKVKGEISQDNTQRHAQPADHPGPSPGQYYNFCTLSPSPFPSGDRGQHGPCQDDFCRVPPVRSIDHKPHTYPRARQTSVGGLHLKYRTFALGA